MALIVRNQLTEITALIEDRDEGYWGVEFQLNLN